MRTAVATADEPERQPAVVVLGQPTTAVGWTCQTFPTAPVMPTVTVTSHDWMLVRRVP